MKILASSLVVLALAGFGSTADAQSSVPQGDSWDSIKLLPDWSGVWENTSFKLHMLGEGIAPYRDLNPPFKPDAQKKFDELRRIALAGGNFPSRSDRCIDMGFPGNMNHPASIYQILFTPGQVTWAGAGSTRRIYTDGRNHNDDFITFQGDSIGHWEGGGVLVADTTALDPGNEFILGFAQGENTHGTERIYLKDKDTLLDDVVFEAPNVLAKPFRYQMSFAKSDRPITEFDCNQGNKTGGDVSGGQEFDLTPPPK